MHASSTPAWLATLLAVRSTMSHAETQSSEIQNFQLLADAWIAVGQKTDPGTVSGDVARL